MEDLWKRKLELDVNNLNRRANDTDERIDKNGKDIAMLHEILQETKKTNELITDVVDYAKKTYEVLAPMAKIVSFTAKIGVIFTIAWHAAKWLALKLGLLT